MIDIHQRRCETIKHQLSEKAVFDTAAPKNGKLPFSGGELYLGIDIGSTSSDVVILTGSGRMLFSDYRRIRGKPIETVREQIEEVFRYISPSKIYFSAATGSAGRFFSELTGITFINEVAAQAAAIQHLYPHLQEGTIIDMGGQDSKLIFISTEQGLRRIRDFALNTLCAAGTGSFLDQQAMRLGVAIEEEFGRIALRSKNVPHVAGRCSVFAKSDMIHLQQQATPLSDIIAGLCLALVRNLKSDLGRGREFVKPLIFTGGVAANIGVLHSLKEVFDLKEGELLVPEEHFFTGGIGAVLVAKSKISGGNGQMRLEKIDEYLSQKSSGLRNVARRKRLDKPSLPLPRSYVYEHLLTKAKEPLEAYLGVDVGSISTNVVVIDNQNRVLAKAYLMTAGNPLEAVRKGLDIVRKKVEGKVRILGAATTGSGRYLTGDFIGADVVINEITAQAAGATIVNPKVDTIFEIGGQDSKYISLENGVVVDFEMNHACAAGTGSFLEEQSQRLGINIDEEFSELALRSESPIKLGERCTVFMESDLLNYQQQGAGTSELVAGLSYSIVTNYLNRVVGRRKIGENICFQGGTAFNEAVWSAFEQVTGKPIMVPDHHEVTGALGAAAIASERTATSLKEGREVKSRFRGFENLISVEYAVESFCCEHCPNHCEIKKVELAGAEPLYYGSRCDRYNLKKAVKQTRSVDAFEYRNRMLFEHAGISGSKTKAGGGKGTIGIPLSLVYWQLLPLFSRFFKSLGFEVVLSGKTDRRIIRTGVESVSAQPCFPVKVAYGHIAELINKKVDYIFIPGIVSMKPEYRENRHSRLCPYVQTLGYSARTVFAGKSGSTEIISVPIHLGEGKRLLQKSFVSVGKKLGMSAFSVYKAVQAGLSAQAGFEYSLQEKGAEILSRTQESGRKLFVLVSRSYNGCDEGMNLQLPKKLSELGAETIPMEMLDLKKVEVGNNSLHQDLYWTSGQKILRAAELIKSNDNLFGIYLSNFGCGPDSFLQTFFKEIMGSKPCLQLELDEHSADTGVITRLEAFLESLKNYDVKEHKRPAFKQPRPAKDVNRNRKIYIPYMSDCSYGVAACLRAYGQASEVMPVSDESSLLEGRRFTTGKECLPCAITAGDMLKTIRSDGFDRDEGCFFMPGGSGPCRFGMYNCMHRLILKHAGISGCKIVSPNQDGSFYRELSKSVNGTRASEFLKHIWTATVGIDLLQKLLLRLRPFAADSLQAELVYNRSVRRWISAIERRENLSGMQKLMEDISEDFRGVELNYDMEKPWIGIVGEIYVRSHRFANMDVIARLEELGAACELSCLAEWIYYTNFTRSQLSRRRGQFCKLFTNMLQDYFQHKTEIALAKPLEKRFGKLAEEPIEHLLNLAGPYLHHTFEGEAILSIGKMIEYCHRGFGGVVNVMPFGCMPSTIVSGQTTGISADCGGIPILNLSFDGQEDPTLTTRLEAFVEQVRQREKSNLRISQLMGICK